MPDILIRGIGLPKGETAELNIRIKPDGTILNHVGIHLRERAIELSPHGDLIDRDALLNRINAYVCGSQDSEFIKNEIIKAMPAIVPAERRKSGE